MVAECFQCNIIFDKVRPSNVSNSRLRHMHRCLCIPEILATITAAIGNVGDDNYLCHGPSIRSSLLAFALTCRTFYEPAMDALWKEVISQLLGCFSTGVVTPAPNVDGRDSPWVLFVSGVAH